MRRMGALAIALALALVAPLGAARPVQAQDQKPAVAVVKDQWGIEMTVDDPSFVRPAGGIIGGAKGTKLKELHVWNGAHEVLIPLADIREIEVTGKSEGDLVPVKIQFARGGDPFDCKVERDLEIHGKVKQGQYQIKMDRVRLVSIRAG